MYLENFKIEKYFIVFLVLFEFTVYLSNDMIMPGMLQVTQEFNELSANIPLALTAFLLGGASIQIILGPLSDSFGRRKLMVFGAGFFFFSSICLYFSNSFSEFIFFRFLQGMGTCFIGVLGYVTVQELFSEKEAVVTISLMANVALIAPLLGPLLGGAYLEFFAWRGIFLITSVLSFISFIGLYFFMPETAHFQYIENKKFTKKADLSMLPNLNILNIFKTMQNILKNKAFLSGCCLAGLNGVPILSWIALSPNILMEKLELSSALYGFCQVPVFGGIILGTLCVSKLLNRFSLQEMVQKGSIFIFISILIMGISSIIFKENLFILILPMSLYGIGLGAYNSSLYRLILYSTNQAKGTVASLFSIITALFFAAGTKLVSLIDTSHQMVGFALFCSVCTLLALPFLFLFLKKSEKKDYETVSK